MKSSLTLSIDLHQDAPTAGAGKHIVFGSDDDDDEDDQDKQQTTSEVTASTKALFEDSQSEHETTVKDNDTVKEKVSEELLI